MIARVLSAGLRWTPTRFFVTTVFFIVGQLVPVGSRLNSQTLTVDEIIAKNIAARGGLEKWQQIRSIKMSGTYVSFSDPKPFTLWRARPDRYRFDSNRIGQYIIHAYDGEKAWWVNPLFGPPNDKPTPIPSQNNLDKVTLRERFFEPVFWNYQTKGHNVVSEGTVQFDGEECYKLEVTLADGSTELWYINAKTFLAVGMTGDTYDFGSKVRLETFFSDYREVDGVLMPFLIESEYGTRYRSMEIAQIEINPEIASNVFTMPDSATWNSDKR